MEIFNALLSYLTILMTIIGGLAFLVSVVTEITKNIGFLKRMPTDLQVIVMSILLCQVAYFAYTSYFSIEIQWYYIAGCFISAFLVAFVAMYGWTKLNMIYDRCKGPGGKS